MGKVKYQVTKVIDPDDDFSKKKSVHSISSLWFIVGLAYIIAIVNISCFIIHYVPELKDADIPFVGKDAWKDLKTLNDFGPKVTGTQENEVLAVNFLLKRIKEIQTRTHQNQNVTLDHQIVSGSYFLSFKPYGMVTLYRKIQNIIVRLEGSDTNALMINCHFDSVPGSPGAADDGANCAIMLELLSILSLRDQQSRHTILFVFNGAEETGLRASHGFITQHKWASDIKAFINLEAAGSGGKETLFQTGPGNTWLLDHYKAVRRPLAQAIGEEIFQSGIIPSDTDFRIFRDFGNLAGLDFAHTSKGYRYHTKFDSIDFLTIGVLQRTGENMLSLVLSLANSFELDDVSVFSRNSSAVYFDYLGFFFIHYSKEVGVGINFVVAILSITVPFLTLTKATTNVHSKHILKESMLGFLAITFGSGFSGLLCYVAAYAMDKMDHSMSWFRTTALAPGIYSTIAVLAHILVYDLVDITLANKKSPISLGLKVQARINGVNIFWAILTLGITVIGFRAGYMFMIILFINLLMSVAIYFMGLHNSVHQWIYFHVLGQFFIILWTSYFYNTIMELLIPITGRSGSARNPDLTISILCCATAVFMCSYMIPLTKLLKSWVTKYLTLITIFLVSLFLAMSTSWGFSYQNESSGNPTIQRHFIAHTTRNFFDENGALRHSDGGFFFMEWDRNAKKTIEGIAIPDVPKQFTEICNDEILCGLPLISSRSLLLGGKWLESSTPKFPDIALIDSHSKIILSDNRVKFSLSSNGTSLSSLFIRPRNDAEIDAWSFTEDVPDTFNKTYFVSIANGIESETFKFDITLKIPENSSGPLIDITLVSMKFDRKQDYTVDFKKILNRVPDWAFAQDCIAAVTSYVF